MVDSHAVVPDFLTGEWHVIDIYGFTVEVFDTKGQANDKWKELNHKVKLLSNYNV